jgi:hypothetical protein
MVETEFGKETKSAKFSSQTIQYLEDCLASQIEEGLLEESLKIAELLGRELTEKEKEKLLEKCIEWGWLEDAERVAETLFGRELTAEELEKIAKKHKERGWENSALAIINLLPEPLKTKYLST